LCELELKPPVVSHGTLKHFTEEIQKRKQKRLKKKKDERRREKKAETARGNATQKFSHDDSNFRLSSVALTYSIIVGIAPALLIMYVTFNNRQKLPRVFSLRSNS